MTLFAMFVGKREVKTAEREPYLFLNMVPHIVTSFKEVQRAGLCMESELWAGKREIRTAFGS